MTHPDEHEEGFLVFSVDASGCDQIAYFEEDKLKEAYEFAKTKLDEYNDKSKIDKSFCKTITITNIYLTDIWNYCRKTFGN